MVDYTGSAIWQLYAPSVAFDAGATSRNCTMRFTIASLEMTRHNSKERYRCELELIFLTRFMTHLLTAVKKKNNFD